jgi:hypothetical protein
LILCEDLLVFKFPKTALTLQVEDMSAWITNESTIAALGGGYVSTEGTILSELWNAAVERREIRRYRGGWANLDRVLQSLLGGAFTDPSLTAEQMMERVRGKLRERHIPGLLANAIVKDILSLGRWAKR